MDDMNFGTCNASPPGLAPPSCFTRCFLSTGTTCHHGIDEGGGGVAT